MTRKRHSKTPMRHYFHLTDWKVSQSQKLYCIGEGLGRQAWAYTGGGSEDRSTSEKDQFPAYGNEPGTQALPQRLPSEHVPSDPCPTCEMTYVRAFQPWKRPTFPSGGDSSNTPNVINNKS